MSFEKERIVKKIASVFLLGIFLTSFFAGSYAYCLEDKGTAASGEFEKIYNEAPLKKGAREITYDQFMKIRNSGEKYILADVLSYDDYRTGHIEGAISFPLSTITKGSAAGKIPPASPVVVYCLSYKCCSSTEAACKLSSYGYKVLDYKGGLDEWQEKNNKLVR